MEANGGPTKMDEQSIPLQKYRTSLYMNSDEPPEKLQSTGQKYKTALYTKTRNGERVDLGIGDTYGQPDDRKNNGLTLHEIVFLIAGYRPGFAVTILMVAVIQTGWWGFLVFAALIFLLACAAVFLANCWNLVRVAWFDDFNPFGAIAYEACGTWARHTVNILVDLVSFGGSIAMLLAASELVLIVIGHTLFATYCYWPLIIGVLMCPAIWVGMPKHFWLLGALSSISTILAIFIIFIGTAVNLHDNGGTQEATELPIQGWGLAKLIGGTIFLMGGHFVYPEIQRAMKEPGQFDRSALTTFILINLFLFPTLLIIFFTYGNLISEYNLEASLLVIIERNALVVIPGLLLLINSAAVLLIIISPLFQHLEEAFNIPEDINWKRILLRTTTILLIIFIAETVNEFAIIMTIVGGIVLPMLTFLAPAVCYLRLRSMYMSDSFSERPKMHIFESIVAFIMIVITPIISVLVFVLTIIALVNDETSYVRPCYVQFYNATNDTAVETILTTVAV